MCGAAIVDSSEVSVSDVPTPLLADLSLPLMAPEPPTIVRPVRKTERRSPAVEFDVRLPRLLVRVEGEPLQPLAPAQQFLEDAAPSLQAMGVRSLFVAEPPPEGQPFVTFMAADVEPRVSATRPVAGSQGTQGAIVTNGRQDQTDEPLMITDMYGNLTIDGAAEMDRRLVFLRGGEIESRLLKVRSGAVCLELDDVRLRVRQGVEVASDGVVVTHVRERSSGLDLDDDVELGIATGRIILFFHDNRVGRELHWGLRALGDRRDELTGLIQDQRLIVAVVRSGGVADADPLIIFDGEFTYVTLDRPVYEDPVHWGTVYELKPIPEPATMVTLAASAIALLRRRR